MKKILVFGMTDNPGGMESCIMNYYRTIDKNEIHFDFLTNFDTMVYSEEVKNNSSKIYHIPKKGKNFINYKKCLKKFFKENGKNYDAIWYNTCTLANVDYLIMAKKYGIKKRIIHAHNSNNEASKLKGILHNIHKRNIAKVATNFWSCSMSASKYFFSDNVINSPKHEIIHNAISLSKYAFNEKIRKEYREKLCIDDKLVIGHVGRFQTQKNHNFLIEIFSQIVKMNNNVVLLLVGQGELENDIKEKVEQLCIGDKVIFLGVRSDVGNILNCMDVFLLPSLFEGLPLVLVEAQTNGLSCVTSKGVVSNESKITDLVNFIGLNETSYEWAKKVINIQNGDRSIYINLVKEAGFDIYEESKKMISLFYNQD